ncbi:disco-interacting protein 2 homolog A isoform X3 [Nasonia vitripennis]|uniref:Disco-interacting protein 2 homolog A n=1 Tax=Nasonia vitripennis TaxID=7425 RepID=A0A7M7J199_NASVI|nr:disco-interacting protein 2 homolog A isoform X3 [Nasonia vitripennis]
MRTLSFENLRRLVGRRKDRDHEPSFERSESFKRISIRKSYLDRGKRRTRLQKASDLAETTAAAPVVTVEMSSRTRTKKVVGPTIVQVRGGGNVSDEFDVDEKKEKRISRDDVEVFGINEVVIEEDDDEDEMKVKRKTPAGTIVYGQWLNDIDSSYSLKDRKYKMDSYSSRDSKFDSSRERIYISQEKRPFAKQNFAMSPVRKINEDNENNCKVSSVLIEMDKSPQLPRSQSRIQMRDELDSLEAVDEYDNRSTAEDYNSTTSNNVITVNAVPRWRDPPSVPATSSYSLSSNPGVESSLEDRYNDRSVISRTVSAPDKPVVGKTDTTSTRASGFSLSLSFSRLTTDLKSAAMTTKNGLFRRRKRPTPMKPSPSVSAQGYFERTAAASTSTRRSRRSNVGSGRRRPVYTSRRRKITTSKPSPAPDSPVWFVPPERRRSNRQRGRVWREVRYLPQDDGKSDADNVDSKSNNWSNDSNLSDEFDDKKLLLSGDFEEKSEASLNPRKADSGSNLDSSSLVSSLASSTSLKPKISDFNEDKIFYEEYRGDKSKPVNPPESNYFASSQFLGFVAKSAGRNVVTTTITTTNNSNQRCGCTSSSESDEPERVLLVVGGSKKDGKDAVSLNVAGGEKRNCSVVLVVESQRSSGVNRQQEVGPGQRRRPLRRKSQLRRGGAAGGNNARGQPVYLARRRSSLRRRPCRDITQKGYEKKRTRLLQQYASKQLGSGNNGSGGGGGGGVGLERTSFGSGSGSGGGGGGGGGRPQPRARRTQRRVTHSEKRYHSGGRLAPGAIASPPGSGGSTGGHSNNNNNNNNTGNSNSAATRRGNRRLTRNESRYHSEVRQEAVQQALAAMQGRPKPSLPMPSKRTSVMARSPERSSGGNQGSGGGGGGNQAGDSSSDEDSVVTEESPGAGGPSGTGLSDTSSTGSARDTPPPPRPPARRPPADITDIAEYTPHAYCNLVQPPDVTHTTTQSRRPAGADRVNRYHVVEDNNTGTTGRWKVSAKIQQLLNTLKRPKRRPLPEFYEDDDIELEIAANPKDPNAPKPEGGTMTPAVGEQLSVPSGLPRSVEASIQRYGSASYKAPAATVLDPNGKLCVTLTYGKLLSRSYKIAYTLLNKALSRVVGECCLKPGDRIALVYPNDDPINFICAFYGCLQAGIVPVPIEVPLTRRDAGSQQIGFLLGSCGIQVALTSEACLKGLPKTAAGEVIAFKGWPKLHWFVTEHLGKTPKDWMPPTRLTDDTPAYIEYTTDRDGSVMGVTVTRAAMLAHCRALTQACGYTEGENAVCVLDFKREVGLWHSTLTSILNGMHVIFIPYALMKVNPASWMQMITKHRASVAVVKSRDLHWGLLATKDHKDISLSTLRLLLVADGANPWSLSSCDQFLSVFQSKGLRPDAVCPCASSSEALTVSVRRPGRAGVNATGRGVLSMSGLSFGVVRVDQENSLTSLTLQDCGQVMPGSIVTVIKMEGPPLVCKTDEVGEICVHSAATGSQYWGLQGLTNNNFKVQPLQAEGQPLGDVEYTRSGLLGFLGPGNLVFVCGSRDGLMTVTGRKHNADDIIATVLAVEPMKFIYRGRIAVFSVRVLRDERICVVAEQRPDCSEEESFQWMSRVLQAVDSIHAVGIYCLALVPPNYLPKTPLGGIHLSETKRRFLEGTLHPANVLLCPHTCVTNLPKPHVGPASVMVGNIVQGNRLASAQGRDMGVLDEDSDNAKKYQFISEILRWRAVGTSDHVIFTSLNSKGAVAASLSCSQLHKKAERIGNLLLDRGRINTGDHVALLFPPGTDLICAFYGCLYVGAVPVTIRPPHPQNLQTTLPTVRMIVDVSKSVLILTNQTILKLLKSKEANNVVEVKSWPTILDMDDMPKKKLPVLYRAPTAEMLAYLDFSVSTTGMLAGIKMSHAAVTSLCRAMKLACELYPSRHIALCLDPYSGLGFALWCLSSIYSGHHSILIPPSEVEANPALWLSAVSHSRVRDTFCSYGVMELCTKGLGSSVHALKARGVSLACVRTCVVVAEERPRIALTSSFSKLFSALGLSPRAVSTSFGCRVNTAICLQGASSPEPSTVYVDLRALRNDRVSLVERGSPHSLCLMESGKLLPGVKVIIANPETKGQCGDSHLGEIWVQSSHNASGYFTIYGDESDYADHFNARLVTGNTNEVYARTGYLGFLRRTESVQQSVGGTDIPGDNVSNVSASEVDVARGDSELHDAVFVVGALDEAILLRGMRYHPIDIENSVMRCHKKIAECAVFTWTNLLVVVVELDGSESEALDLVALVTSAVLEEHHLVVGVVVVVDPGVVPINSRGEKQRMHLRDGFLADQLDPIYVAYNM